MPGSDAVLTVERSTGTGRKVIETVPASVYAGALVGLAEAAGARSSFPKTHAAATALLAASVAERVVLIVVTVTTTFAAGNGAAPIFDFGETGTGEKFKANLATGTAGDVLIYAGVLSANKALLVSGTAATGTGDGAIDVTVFALPNGN